LLVHTHPQHHATGLPFACLVTKIILQFELDISVEPKMKIQDSLGNQTLMKSNAQLWHEGQDETPRWRLELPLLRLLLSLHSMMQALLRF
jgi:hypothetical protein